MKEYTVYMHVFPNNKKYIGITCQKPEYRWSNGKGYVRKDQSKMYNAIQKYGWENIEHKILFSNLTREEADQKEKELIEYYKTYNDQYGYNIEHGGIFNIEISEQTRQKMILNHKGMLGKHRTKEERERQGIISKERWKKLSEEDKEKERRRLSEIRKGKSSWNKGISPSDETRKKLSLSWKEKYKNGYVAPRKGQYVSKETRQKIREKRLGIKLSEQTKEKMKKNNSNAKKIIVLETGQIFNSGKECAEILGCHRSNPNFVCNGRTKTCKGYHLMWLDDYNKCSATVASALLG